MTHTACLYNILQPIIYMECKSVCTIWKKARTGRGMLRFIFLLASFFVLRVTIPAQSIKDNGRILYEEIGESHGLYARNITGFVFDKTGMGWIGNRNGLLLYDGQRVYEAGRFMNMHQVLFNKPVQALFYDSTYNTLLVFFLHNSAVTELCRVYLDRIWEGSLKDAVQVVNRHEGILRMRPIYLSDTLTCAIGGHLMRFHITKTATNLITDAGDQSISHTMYSTDGRLFVAKYFNDSVLYSVSINGHEAVLRPDRQVPTEALYNFFYKNNTAIQKKHHLVNYNTYKLEQCHDLIVKANLASEAENSIGIAKDKRNNYYLYGALGIFKFSATINIAKAITAQNETRFVWLNPLTRSGLVATSTGIQRFCMTDTAISDRLTRGLDFYSFAGAVYDSSTVHFFPYYSRDHLAVYNPTQDRFTFRTVSPGFEIYSCLLQRDGKKYYLGTDRGLCAASITKDSLLISPLGIRDKDQVFAILQYGKDKLVIATTAGLYLVQPGNRKVTLLKSGEFLCLAGYSKGLIAGSRHSGIYVFTDEKLTDSIDINKGLKSSTIYSLKYDANLKILWAGTANGLTVYQMKTGLFRTFTEQNGLAHNELNRNSVYSFPDESALILGGLKGLSVIRSRDILPVGKPVNQPPVWAYEAEYDNGERETELLTESSIREIGLKRGVKKLLIKSIQQTDGNTICAIAYRFDNDVWHYTWPGTDIELTDIEPGLHHLYVKMVSASLREGNEMQIFFRVEKLWYKGFLFTLGLLIAGAVLLFVIIRMRDRYIRIKAAEELNRQRERFFGIIAHDLRSPVKAYQGLSETITYLIEKDDRPRLLKIARETDQIARNLHLLINNLLYWSLMQQKELKPVMALYSYTVLTQDILPLYRAVAQYRQVQITERVSADASIHTDRSMMSMIIRNLIDNAVKYSPAFQEVYFEMAYKDKAMCLIIRNRYHADKEAYLRSITRQYRNENWVPENGVGLRFIWQSVRLLGGEIHVETDPSIAVVQWTIIIPDQRK